uniref:Uncharacterized protein n=1 Tax=Cyprinodon variegatus TaxID=28743 RepID=A0A3Q2CN75_CYPVA
MVARQQSLAVMDQILAPVPFGRQALPLLIQRLQHKDASCRLRALTSLCDLVRQPERLYGLVNGGNPLSAEIVLVSARGVRLSLTKQIHHVCLTLMGVKSRFILS